MNKLKVFYDSNRCFKVFIYNGYKVFFGLSIMIFILTFAVACL